MSWFNLLQLSVNTQCVYCLVHYINNLKTDWNVFAMQATPDSLTDIGSYASSIVGYENINSVTTLKQIKPFPDQKL